MSESASPASAVEYIQHHLQNLCVGDCDPVTRQAGFWTWNLDTLFFGWLTASVIVFIAFKIGRNLQKDTPTGLQNVIESIVEFVDQQIKDIFPGRNPLI